VNSILFDGVQVGSGASIADSIVADGCEVSDGCQLPRNTVLATGDAVVTTGLWIGSATLEGLLRG
jgi:ADP-glucose pyrophosphorylase